MKKALLIILTLSLVLTFSAGVLAENPTSGSTALSYNVGSTYAVTIPPTVTISGGTATGEYIVNAASLIPADKSLTFTITGATNYDTDNSKFRLLNGSKAGVYLGYTIMNGVTPVTKDTAFLTATPEEAYNGKTVTLTYTTDTAESAGTYTDTVTITVGQV